MSKKKFLYHAARYVRRPPLPQNHIVEITERDIRFLAKKRKNNCGRVVTLQWSKKKLVDTLGHHVRTATDMRYGTSDCRRPDLKGIPPTPC
jgi:Putative transposase